MTPKDRRSHSLITVVGAAALGSVHLLCSSYQPTVPYFTLNDLRRNPEAAEPESCLSRLPCLSMFMLCVAFRQTSCLPSGFLTKKPLPNLRVKIHLHRLLCLCPRKMCVTVRTRLLMLHYDHIKFTCSPARSSPLHFVSPKPQFIWRFCLLTESTAGFFVARTKNKSYICILIITTYAK